MPPADAADERSPVTLPEGFRASTLRGTEGFIRAGQDAAGRWWLLDPEGRPFFCRAVHGVRALPAAGDDSAEVPFDAAARLRRWGFNTVGVGGDGAGRDDGLPFLATVGFCESGRCIAAPGVRLPDVFAPDWAARAVERALAFCGPRALEPALIGWVMDDPSLWGQVGPGPVRPGLLQVCLSLEPSFSAYHAAWEFVLALHGGRVETLARAWSLTAVNREGVRELTRTEQAITSRGYARDEERWTREFARRYFNGAAAAVRAADPHHLVLGCRQSGPVGASVLAECVYPAVDVVLTHWSELPAQSAGPVLASDVCWAEHAFREAPTAARGGRKLTTVERMLRRGRAALERMARHPAVVGFVWREWLDEPGEQAPFARGLVHVNGTEAREHTELLAAFNQRAESLRRASSPSSLFP
jgi:agarase